MRERGLKIRRLETLPLQFSILTVCSSWGILQTLDLPGNCRILYIMLTRLVKVFPISQIFPHFYSVQILVFARYISISCYSETKAKIPGDYSFRFATFGMTGTQATTE